ncbi:hypothetical protein JQ634_04465 [Bradyrhizobium sp. AUGA SZCCT0240]|jgi:hypothetical protein|nr:hypothetical protein [Bradyrhizobium sp. AUGA SZCCT0160]MBR1195037.1 hypothetical protein [Bradyrhizobium sp. AUGA SZCCT0158]MBR1244986.1 hypothetical protein [Bradyrhizobium sp. AUGA SZCCT0274]MBR1251565.1 hypothetical protein [Bradyrhizobium sp. AUGA SZCCT0169]MBR1252948.1 hypothetical protein [Bradyrhizobium sp. AUGA SZCCT0240]
MRFSKGAAIALVVGSTSVAPASSAHAAPDCSASTTLANWGENSTGDIDIAAGESCVFPIKIRGTVTSSEISQKPARGKLKKLDASTYEYRAKAKYKGSDTFVIKATGKGPTASGTSVITVNATIK